MLVLDSSSNDVGIFNYLFNVVEKDSVYYHEIRRLFVMTGDVKLVLNDKCIGLIFSNVTKKIRALEIPVDAIIMVDDANVQDSMESINAVICKYDVRWEAGYDASTLIDGIKYLRQNKSLAGWTPIAVTTQGMNYTNVTADDLASFLSNMEDEEDEVNIVDLEDIDEDLPYGLECEECENYHKCLDDGVTRCPNCGECEEYCDCDEDDI
jgi:hypothetical protein